jgi:hypothetical protein
MTTHPYAHANAARTSKRLSKGAKLDELLASGEPLKRAAHLVGWSYRSAHRWRHGRKATS